MKELAYHVLDIANNSVRGEATRIDIEIYEKLQENQLKLIIEDNGRGIETDILGTIKDPFTTSRKMRKVGLGIPFLNDTCRMCNGALTIESKVGEGTKVTATMEYNHIDRPPLGDISSTITTLIASEEEIDVHYRHWINDRCFEVSTHQLKEILNDVPLNQVEVVMWLKEYIKEQVNDMKI